MDQEQGHKAGEFVYNFFRNQCIYNIEFNNASDMASTVFTHSEDGLSYPSTKRGAFLSSYVDGVEMDANALLDWAEGMVSSREY